jgi:hypothetical protein
MVTGVNVALFIHILGVAVLFTAMGFLQRGGAKVRAASTAEEMRLWLSLVETTGRMFPLALLFILGSGLYMTDQVWSFDTPWIAVAIVSVILMGVIGGVVVGRDFSAMGRAAAGASSSDLTRAVGAPLPWIAATALNGMGIGVVWLMTIKPGWTQSILVVTILTVLGGVIGAAMVRRPSGS